MQSRGIAGTLASSKKFIKRIIGKVEYQASNIPKCNRGSGSLESQAPEFNIVGTSGVNQIADVVASQAPIKAYVVANDVTTAQALDRNIVESATL
jgi:hypothetical protein